MNTNNETTVKSSRGRPRKGFSFPTTEFRVKELATQLGISVPLVHLKIREAGDAVKVVRQESQGRGRAANVYLYTSSSPNVVDEAIVELPVPSEVTPVEPEPEEEPEIQEAAKVQEPALEEAW